MSSAQLARSGLGRGAISHRVRAGRLHRLHKGVYAVEYISPSPHTRLMAAVLACGPEAAISHMSAAELWDLVPKTPGPIEVTTERKRARPGLLVHQARHLPSDHVTTHFGIPVTTVARTLVDISPRLDDRALARAINDARLARGTTLEQLDLVIASLPKREGSARLRAIVDRHRGRAPTRSTLEDRFLALINKTNLPRPEINRRLLGYEVDALWPHARLVVELDGRRYHSTARDFERDRLKDAELTAAGYRVVRITWQRLHANPATELRRLKHLLNPIR